MYVTKGRVWRTHRGDWTDQGMVLSFIGTYNWEISTESETVGDGPLDLPGLPDQRVSVTRGP